MTIQDEAVETFAENFYRYHEALGPDFGSGRPLETDWEHLASSERKRFVAAARLALLQIKSESSYGGELFVDWSSGGSEGRECGC